ncbi:hypothetical protein XENOCAPTIV_011571, partial [Xenoophorus captivus]
SVRGSVASTLSTDTIPSKEHLALWERELAELTLAERGDPHILDTFQRQQVHRSDGLSREPVDNERHGLIPIHRHVESWLCVTQDQQLCVVIEEVGNTFSPALSLELLLYNALGSNSDFAMCLVHFPIRSYSTNQAWSAHIKTTLRNMIHSSILAGFTPCVFLPWGEIRSLALSLSGKAAVTNQLRPGPWCRSSEKRRVGAEFSSLAKSAYSSVKSCASLFCETMEALTTATSRQVYTSTGVDRSSLARLADVMLSSRGQHQQAGLSIAGNAIGKPLLDNLPRFLVSEHQPDMIGLNTTPDLKMMSGVEGTVSEHKSASVSHSLSEMMATMISEE